jgi:hypothetical protein
MRDAKTPAGLPGLTCHSPCCSSHSDKLLLLLISNHEFVANLWRRPSASAGMTRTYNETCGINASVDGKLSASQQKKNLQIIKKVSDMSCNKICADCPTKNPRWASISLGIFVCLPCSGIHRNLGVHISKVG